MNKDISLVLGSDGARGLAHIGVIEELEQQGYRIKSVTGSSMGSLVSGKSQEKLAILWSLTVLRN